MSVERRLGALWWQASTDHWALRSTEQDKAGTLTHILRTNACITLGCGSLASTADYEAIRAAPMSPGRNPTVEGIRDIPVSSLHAGERSTRLRPIRRWHPASFLGLFLISFAKIRTTPRRRGISPMRTSKHARPPAGPQLYCIEIPRYA
jgi:hypothetical protein